MQVHLLIAGMLPNEKGHSFLVGPAMGSKLAMEFAAGLGSLFFTKEVDKKAIAKLMQRGAGLASRRNTVVHSAWGRGKKPAALEPLGLKVRSTVRDLGQALSEKAFVDLADEIHALSRDVSHFAQARGLSLRKSP